MNFENRWYWCDIAEADEAGMPDLSRVPEEKREMVMQRWKERQANLPKSRWQLWGPQIALYQAWPSMQVEVVGPVV